ncbi:biotin carboxylase N-terminal domain-containing protein [Bermanella sp. R86510]|uniref:ATP-binding protein n=1 Tax=unclassified Bermanella TaxID=2627862 RepID=UPI0037C9C020
MNKNKIIKRLLIANRGEIAIRIMHSAQKLGIHCIALYSDADRDALHVKQSNEAWYIGPSPAKDSYLVIDKVLAVAKQANADAIHPGYGFLSENALFAQAVQDAGIIWVGPSVNAIKAMGSKSESKRLMEQANVPLVPGYHGDNQDESFLAEQVLATGLPVLVKASAGGGGKGMRVIDTDDSKQIQAAIAAAKREGKNSFGDDKLLVEKYITRPRHVEIQVFMDTHGNGVYLFERDCSIQRRHQKVVEEAPAPNFDPEQRTLMGEAALQAARAINYIGAGTVEFLYDEANGNPHFYFMEMNTRLQVEHPVTEMITGQDLVAWQLKVAQGDTLPLTQDQLSITGHSMEVRIYAEDPDNDFLPTTGQLDYVRLPQLIEGRVRLDTGVTQGDKVSPYYDPMISKLIVWGEDRQQCLSQLKSALQSYQIAGVTTNLSFLRRVVNQDDFALGKVSTQFIDEHQELLLNPAGNNQNHIFAAAAFHLLKRSSLGLNTHARNDKNSPWHMVNGFRLNQKATETLSFIASNDERIELEIETLSEQRWKISFDNITHEVTARSLGDQLQFEVDNQWHCVHIIEHSNEIWIYDNTSETHLVLHKLDYNQQEDLAGSLTAPMNGTIIEVNCHVGDNVKAGDTLLIMEAMKMEHSITAPVDGTIKELSFSLGDLVDEGAVLVDLDELETEQ